MKRKCIYCLEENELETQKNREHIFPKTYGGQRRLELGIVCDTCNNKFSAFESDFAKESLLTIPKQFYHPLSKKNKQGKISFKLQLIEVVEQNKYYLGYIQEGVTHFCPQISLRKNMEHSFVYFSNFIKNLDFIIHTKINKIQFVKHIKIKEKEPIIGIYNNRVVAYYNHEKDKENLIKFKSILSQKRQEIIELYDPNKVSKTQNQFIVHQEYSFNLDSTDRAVCKIALNTIAHYFGDKIFDPCFDELRNYIKTGNISYKPVALLEKAAYNGMFANLFYESKNNHFALVGSLPLHERESIIALVSFYDDSFAFAVRLKQGTKFNIDISELPMRLLVINYQRKDQYGDYELFEEQIKEDHKIHKENINNLFLKSE